VSVIAIVLIVLAALVLLLLIGGYVATRRRSEALAGSLLRDVAAANEALAAARAQDRGWDRDAIDAAARAAYTRRHPDGGPITAMHLIQVVDRPGTDQDEAILHVVDASGEHEIQLGRSDGEWMAKS